MKKESRDRIIIQANRILSAMVYIAYPALLAILIIKREPGIAPALIVPGVSFIIVSIFRGLLDSPRPYEVTGKAPLIKRKGRGKSFPSRHVFSVFVIAVTLFYFYRAAGIAVGIIGLALAAIRVLGGLHFVKDVVAGALIGIICGVAGFYIICPLI